MSYSGYFKHLKKRAKEMVRCPECLNHFKLRDYATHHVVKVHGLNLKKQCMYCGGNAFLKNGKRCYKHLFACMKQFLKDYQICDIVPEETKEQRFEYCDCKNFRSESRQMYGRVKDRLSDYLGFYDSMFERSDQYPSEIRFSQESGLSEVYGIVKRYEKGDLQWCHLMVMHQNWQNFVTAMKEIEDEMFLLPYWCLCDGLGEQRKTHRHMIIAYEPESGFEELWRDRVKCPLPENGKSKYCVRIKDAFHLVRTIAYVSQRKASCDGNEISEETEEGNLSHFCLNRQTSEHAIAYMSTTLEGGMERLLAEQLKNKNVVGWLQWVVSKCDVHGNVKHAVPIGITGFKFLKCVLPLESRFQPSETPTELYLTWLGDKRLYLNVDKDLMRLPRQEWYDHQMQKGNWLGCLENELYVLGRSQQNVMNQIKEAIMDFEIDERRRLEKKYRKLKEKEDESDRMHQELIKRERQMNDELIKRERQMNDELMKRERQMNEEWMKRERQMNEEWMKREMQMKEEIQSLKSLIEEMKEEIQSLKKLVQEMDEEI